MIQGQSLIAELEDAIESGFKDKRVDTLRRITDLFVADANRFNDQQIEVFDDVLSHLIKRIEGKALAELSQRIGPINNAPLEVVRRLARDDDIAVAKPVLMQSNRLTDYDLVDIATTKTQGHLLAIAARPQIGPNVTDALLQRGDQHVFYRLAENAGANFSEDGFATLVKHSERDEYLAEKVGSRLDVPLRLFRELLLRATEAVRARLLALAGPDGREKIQQIVAAISEDAQLEARFQNKRDLAEAHTRMLALKEKGELNEVTLYQFAKTNQYAEVIAALSVLCGASIQLVENLLQNAHREAWLIPCKAAGLEWSTVRAVMACRSVGRVIADQTLDSVRVEYSKLAQSSAARVLRFWQVRKTASKQDSQPSGSAVAIAQTGAWPPLASARGAQ